MKTIKSCEFNMDTGCVELQFQDGSMISIDCTAVENEVADNRFQRSELDYLIYNDPLAYADLILNGDVEAYLNAVTEYKPYENRTNAQKGMAVGHPLLPCCFRSIYPLDLSYIYRQATFSPLLSLSVFAPSRAAFHSANSR